MCLFYAILLKNVHFFVLNFFVFNNTYYYLCKTKGKRTCPQDRGLFNPIIEIKQEQKW